MKKTGNLSVWSKLRYIYLPFIIILASFMIGYTFLNWALVIETEWLQIKEDVANIWLPLALSWIPVTIWLRNRIKLLSLKGGNGNIPSLYFVIASLAIAVPTMITQSYVAKASGELKKFYSIDRISLSNPSKYYSFKSHYIDKGAIGIYTSFEVSGKHNEDLNMQIYVAAPLLEKASDTVYSSCLAWMGYKYTERISNRLEDYEKEAKFRAFAERSQADFESKDLNKFLYIERMLNSDDADAFKEALKTSPKSLYGPQNKLVFLPVDEPFENRTGNRGMWIVISLLIGISGWLLMILLPKADEKNYQYFLNGEPFEKEEDSIAELLIPKKDWFITPILLYLNILVFAVMVIAGLGFMNFKAPDLLAWGGNFRPSVLDGEWWRLFTSTFLHGGILHLVANMYALVFIGIFLEPALGRVKFLVAYLVTGLLASCASIWWFEATVSIGASGAIFGLYGLFLAMLLRKVFPKAFSKPLLVSILIFVGYNLVIGTSGGVDNAAHIGGLLSGFLIGLVISPFIKQQLKGDELEYVEMEPNENPAAKTSLTRAEYIAICRQCTHKELDLNTGIICGLTKEKADFEEKCDDFEKVKAVSSE